MTGHCSVELLSAFHDGELAAHQRRRVEDHLATCDPCRDELAALRGIARRLRTLEPVATPQTLELALARRIAREAARPSLLRRLEARLSRIDGQPAAALGFALVVALAVIVVLFAQAVETARTSHIPVRFAEPAAEEGRDDGELLEVAGRRLRREAAGWRETGVTGPPERRIVVGSSEWNRWIAASPSLVALAELDEPVLVEEAGEVVEIRPGPFEPGR